MHFRIFALICLSVLSHVSAMLAQGSAFTYQGRLQTNGVPYTGSAEFQFTLWDAASAGTTIAVHSPATVVASVDSGLFTVTLDFGAAAFDGQPRFLQIEARTALGAFTMLTPRQALGSTPYALRALNSATAANVSGNIPVAQITGTVPLSQLPTSVITNGATDITLSGTFSGNGSGLTGLNASQLTAGIVPSTALSNAWQVGGNTGTTPEFHFLGTADNSPLEIRANNLRAFRIEPTAGGPNLIGGGANNSIGAFTEYATISGGRLNQIGTNSDGSVIAGGGPNFIGTNATYGAIGGGVGNFIGDFTDSAVIVGGFENAIGTNLTAATISGGAGNAIESGAGYSIVAGGSGNRVATDVQNAFVAGTSAHALHQGSFVWADASDPSTPFGSTTAHQFNARATGGVRFETAGAGMTVDGQTVVAAPVGTAQIANSAITVGKLAASAVTQAKIADSAVNSAKIADSSIQAADVDDATFNTTFWRAGGNSGTTPGTHFLGTTDNQALEIKVNGGRALRLEPGTLIGAPNILAGSPRNFVGSGINGVTISGGGATNFGGLAFTNGSSGAYTVVAGGLGNIISSGAIAAVLGGGANNFIRTNSGYSVISGGGGNEIGNQTSYGTVSGGVFNKVGTNSSRSTIGGGSNNDVLNNSTNSTIAGGTDNLIGPDAGNSTIAGGFLNHIGTLSVASSISGGTDNSIENNCQYSIIGGGLLNSILSGSSESLIAGGSQNQIQFTNLQSVISGGNNNIIGRNSLRCLIGGGYGNRMNRNNANSTIAGGRENEISDDVSEGFIGGGSLNRISAIGATIAGGSQNVISLNSFGSTIAGGTANGMSSDSSDASIGGGNGNFVLNNADYATIPGGLNNVATNFAFAAGRQAKANHTGSFVWGDSTAANILSSAPNSVTMRASGGYRLFSNSGASIGVSLAAGGNAWAVVSDRNRKKDVEPLDGTIVLDKLAKLPISSWHYDFEPSDATPHIGPMAQDFKAAFYPGRDDKTISTMEFDGVALAAIQGLNEKVEGQLKDEATARRSFETQLQQKDAEIAALKESFDALKELVHALNQKVERGTK